MRLDVPPVDDVAQPGAEGEGRNQTGYLVKGIHNWSERNHPVDEEDVVEVQAPRHDADLEGLAGEAVDDGDQSVGPLGGVQRRDRVADGEVDQAAQRQDARELDVDDATEELTVGRVHHGEGTT